MTMNMKSMLAVAFLSLGMAQTVNAQNKEKGETRTYPSWFAGVQGGAQAVLNGYNLGDVVTPIGALQGGVYISPALGARLQVNGWMSKEGIKSGNVDYGTYKFNYAAANVDLLVNLTNAFSSTDDHRFNVILTAGLGVNKAWGSNYKDIANLTWNGTADARDEVNSRTHNHVAHNDRVGLIFDYRLNNNWSVNLEGTANHIGSRTYAINYNAGRDWQLQALVGLTYTFGKKNVKAKPAPVAMAKPEPKPEPKPQPKPEPKPEPKPQVKPEPKPEKPKETAKVKVMAETQTNIFFGLAKTKPVGAEADKVAKFAEWMKKNPTTKATIKGYADSGTGNPTLNNKYAELRAETIKRMLVEKYGIDASRLTVSSYGDTVQPMSENDDNRVVIAVAKE